MIKESLNMILEHIQKGLESKNIFEYRIDNYDGYRLMIIGSMDLSYYHTVEIIFNEVSYIDCPTDFNDCKFREASVEEKIELRKNKLHYCENGITTCIELEGYEKQVEKHFMVSQSIDYNFDMVFHYKRENLEPGQRLADWVK